MLRSIHLVSTATAALVLASIPSPASAHSSEVYDAVGDVTPGYLDIVHAKVTMQKGNGTLFFITELAQAVPNPPVDAFVAYNYQVDTNADGTFEFAIVVRWFNGQWETLINDVRPPGAVLFFSDASWDGATVKVRLDPALLGDPATFRWRAVTRLVIAPGPLRDVTDWVTWER